MLKERLKRLNELHTVQGLILGWLLYFVCFSGTIAVLYHEIEIWEQDSKRYTSPAAADWIEIHPLVEKFALKLPAQTESINVSLPSTDSATYEIDAWIKQDDQWRQIIQRFHATSGEELNAREGEGAAHWLRQLHRNLMTNSGIGRMLVGFTGVYMLVLILTGVVIHRRILKDLFKIRWSKSIYVKWRDLHNAFGLWTLPFGVLVSFSGIMVGIPVLFASLAFLSAFKGDASAMQQIDALMHAHERERMHVPAQMYSLDAIVRKVQQQTEYNPTNINIRHWGDRAASIKVYAFGAQSMVMAVEVPVDAITGELLMDDFSLTGQEIPNTAAGRMFLAMFPLHYGTFGGITIKLLYVALGIALSLSIVFGMLIYVERRLNGPIGQRSQRHYHHLNLLNAGIMAGLPLANIAVFYADRLYIGAGEDRLWWVGSSYLGVWLASVVWCFILQSARRGARYLLALTALSGLLLPFFDYLTLPAAFWSPAVMAVNGTFLVSALSIICYLHQSACNRAPIETQSEPIVTR